MSGHLTVMEPDARFELLYVRHAPAVKAYVLRRGAGTHADDLVTEVFLVCLRRLDDLPEDPLPWLLGVARRVLGTHRRGERRRAALNERLNQVELASVPEGEGLEPALVAALQCLSEQDRELLLLIAWEGLTPGQAAAVLGLRAATLRVRLHRARSRFRVALSGATADASTCPALPLETS